MSDDQMVRLLLTMRELGAGESGRTIAVGKPLFCAGLAVAVSVASAGDARTGFQAFEGHFEIL